MTDVQIPSFNFSKPLLISDKEAEKLLNGDRLVPYQDNTLEVLDCIFMKVSDKDPTWGQYKLILSQPGNKLIDGKAHTAEGKKASSVTQFLLVPMTSKNLYADEDKPRQYSNIKRLLTGFGIEVNDENFGDVIVKHFNKPEVWRQRKVTGYLGYEKEHIAYKDGVFFLADRKGEPLAFEGNKFDSRDRADGFAARHGVNVNDAFLRVLKFKPIEGAVEIKAPIEIDDEGF